MKFLRATTVVCALAALSSCDLTGNDSKKSDLTTGQDKGTTGQTFQQTFGTSKDSTTASAIASMPTEVGTRLDPAARKQLETANSNYLSTLKANPDDAAAGFGVAVTSLSLQMDNLSDSLKRMYDAGLRVGNGDNPGDMFRSNPTTLASGGGFSARKLSNPQNAPKISELQTMLETKLMPTIDSAVTFLDKCWNTPDFKYRFPIDAFGKTDSLTIGRADIGFALAGLRTARAYFTWVLAQNVDCDFNGSYAWLDTLSNVDDEVGPSTAAQEAAFQNLQTLLAPGSSFLTVRSGYQPKVNSIPAELISIAQLAKQAGDYSVLHQLTLKDGLVQLKADDNADLAKVMDSVQYYLGGMRTFVKPPYTDFRWVAFDTCTSQYGYYSCGDYQDVAMPGFSLTVNVSKLITQADHKVFLPRFSWNASSTWATKGPFSLLKGTAKISVKELDALNLDGAKSMTPYIEWADPTFGGVFSFANSGAVLNQLEAMDEKPTSTASMSPLTAL